MSIIEQALEIQIQSWLTKKMVSKKKKKGKNGYHQIKW